MKTFQIDVPKLHIQNRSIRKRIGVTNSEIRAALEKLNSQPAKRVCDDLGLCVDTIYRIRRNYVLKDSVLYRRVEDGDN